MAQSLRPIASAMRARGGRWLSIVRLLPLAGGALLAAAILLNLLIGLLPIGFAAATSEMLSRLPRAVAAPAGRWQLMAGPLVLAIGAFALLQVLAPMQTAVGEVLSRRIDGACIRRLLRAAVGVDLPTLERPEELNLLSDARTGFHGAMPTPGAAAAGALALVARYAQMTGAIVVLAVVLHLPAALVVAVTVLVIRFGQRRSLDRFAGLWKTLAGRRRRMVYLRELASGAAAAKEIRVLGLLPWLHDRHRAETRGYLAPLWADRRSVLGRPFLGYAAAGLAGGTAAFLWLAHLTTAGRLGVYELSLGVQAILIALRFGVFFPESDVQTQYGLQALRSIEEFERAAGATPTAAESRPAHVAPPPGKPTRTIRFESVTFRYGSAERPVLRGLDLDIPVGRSLAVVGLNGAGKTTIVKLLTKLYSPTGGRIVVDGTDLAAWDSRDWQHRLAVIFQDYIRYELSAAANIGLGRPERMSDRAAIRAAADRADATAILDRLPAGFDTVLSREYRDGHQLSGGQWQRVALARALFAVAAGASVLVLDEPTAQLDVRAEVEFYDRFLDLTRGLTTVIISHRFSTVRRADRIAVIDGGRVVEQGTHEELLDRDGEYARLFRMQAERFRDGGGDPADLDLTAEVAP